MRIQFAIKTGLAAGTIYYIADQGVWKDSETTSKVYNDIKKHSCPYIKEATTQLPFEVPKLPQVDNVIQLGVHYWNAGVKATFSFLLNSPTHATNLSKCAYKSIESFINPPDVPEN